jgi:uncharacterized protein (PEP-CTERM system associated)
VFAPTALVARTTAGTFAVNYNLSRVWSAIGRATVARSDYVDSVRRDTLWGLSATLNYSIWRNLAATLDYQYIDNNSNIAGVAYTKNVVSAGLTYKY